MGKFYNQTDYRTILYAIIRIALGMYLLVHSVFSLIDFDRFMITALEYLPEDSSISFLAYLTPIIPFMEFFLSVMILTGLYTKAALRWAIGVGIFFMVIFHYLEDLTSAMEHAYSVIIKLSLFFTIYYNKISLDYYNQWTVRKEVQSIEQKYQ